MQIGRGQFEPPTDVQCDVELQYYRYKNSIDADILNADLVISHAGECFFSNRNELLLTL